MAPKRIFTLAPIFFQVGSTARTYDAVGNTLSIGGTARQFVYSNAGRMRQAKTGGTVRMNYVYNGKGEQVRRYLRTTNTYTLYDEAGQWLGEYRNDGAPIQQVIWLDSLPVGVISGGKLHYIEADHLGTPRVIVDPVRNVSVWKWDLTGEAFGETPPKQDVDGDKQAFVFNMRYPGQRYDAASGLNYNYFRDGYEPPTGRYSQSDPIGLRGGINTYAYVGGNPVSFTDRLGLDCDQRGCWVTPMQQGYANSGNYSAYYQSACAGGDRYACSAGRVAANDGFWANRTNDILRGGLKKNGASDKECETRTEDIRKDLAKAHADALSGGSPQNPIRLTGDQISDFHHVVFSQNYGGKYLIFGGDIPGAWVTGWCTAPGCW